MPDDNRTHGRSRGRLRLPQALSSLRHRDYALFSFGQLISLSGTWMQNTAQGYLVYHLTGSAIYLGLVTALGTIPMLFLTLPGGSLADRVPKRKLLLVTQSILLIQGFLMFFLVATNTVKIWHILALALVSGITNAMDNPTRQSFTYELVGKKDLLNGIALNSSIFNLTRIIGPPVAGVIIAAYGTHICFLIDGISYLAALGALLMMRNVPIKVNREPTPFLKDIVEGLRYSFSHVTTRELLIMTGVVSIFAMQYSSLLPAYARAGLGLDAKGLGFLMSAAGIGALLGASTVAALSSSIKTSVVIVVGLLIAPIGLLGASFAKSLHTAMFFIAFIGLGMMGFLSVSNSVIQMDAPDDLRGRVMSVRTLLFSGFAPIGAMLLGWIAQVHSVSRAMQFGATMCAISAIVLIARYNTVFGKQA